MRLLPYKTLFTSVGTSHTQVSVSFISVCVSTVGYFLFLELLSSLGVHDLLSLGFYPLSPGAPCLSGLLTFLLPTLQGSVVAQSPVLSTLEFSLFPLWSPLLSWIPPSSLHPHDLFIQIYAFISATYTESQDCFSINSSVLSSLYSPTLTSIHDHWKNHSLE